MTAGAVEVSAASDEQRAVATITLAFSSDPIVRWAIPDPDAYLTHWPRFVRADGGGAFAEGTADSVDDLAGIALWLAPGVEPDEEAMGAILTEAVPAENQDEVFAVLGQMGDFHPSEPHWYLPLIGVDPTKLGLGYGSTLLRHALHRCDRDHLPAYLEATGPRNRALYLRHGFEELGVIQAGGSPPMWPMLRRPLSP